MPDYQITYDLKICSPLQCTWSIGSAPGVNQRDHGWLGNNYEVIAAPAWCNHVLRTKFDEFITDLSIFTDRPDKFSLFFFNVGSTGCPQNHVGWKVLAEAVNFSRDDRVLPQEWKFQWADKSLKIVCEFSSGVLHKTCNKTVLPHRTSQEFKGNELIRSADLVWNLNGRVFFFFSMEAYSRVMIPQDKNKCVCRSRNKERIDSRKKIQQKKLTPSWRRILPRFSLNRSFELRKTFAAAENGANLNDFQGIKN